MSELLVQVPPIKRLASGIPGLDAALRGGFLQGGIYLVMGAPGAGKTILGNQIAFHHAAQGAQILYVTLLAETHDRMMAHLSGMSFFELGLVSRQFHYLSGYASLEQTGLRGLWAMLRKEVLAREATILILDGLSSVEEYSAGDLTFRRFLHEMQAYNQASGCTTFMLTQRETSAEAYSGHTMADGLIELTKQYRGPLVARELEISKLRGVNYLEGRHRFEITAGGIQLYPRIEVAYPIEPDHGPPSEPAPRLALGINRLDDMLRGGLVRQSTTLLLGAPGSGKTMLGTHFLAAGARVGQRGLYLGFNEQPRQLIAKTSQVGLDFGAGIDSGQIMVRWQAPLEPIPDALAAWVIEQVTALGVERVFIDSLQGLRSGEIYEERFPRFVTALSNKLRAMGVTTVLALELNDLFSPTIVNPIEGISPMIDNIIFLRYVELRAQLHRLISVLKTRESDYESAIREFQITPAGIDVAPTFESAEAILTGVARIQPR
ncbi:MAG TPA: ATPase domain-containing protein [Herpetosiphonaceae bacterium]